MSGSPENVAEALGCLCEADRELARALDMLHHIQVSGFYPPASDQAAREEFGDYLASIEAARIRLASNIERERLAARGDK